MIHSRKGRTANKRARRMCHDDYTICTPVINVTSQPIVDPREGRKEVVAAAVAAAPDGMTHIETHTHYTCTKASKVPHLIEEIYTYQEDKKEE